MTLTDPRYADPRFIGYTSRGIPIISVAGGSGTADEDPDKPKDDDADKPKDDDPGAGDKDEPFDEARARAKIAKTNSEAANLRARLKEAEKDQAELKKLKDAEKSDLERTTDEKKSLEDRAAKAEIDVLRLRVALRKGLSETQAKRLIGTTEEELEADADELLDSFKPADGDKPKGGNPPSGRPKERLRGGGEPDDEPEETDPRKLAGQVPRA